MAKHRSHRQRSRSRSIGRKLAGGNYRKMAGGSSGENYRKMAGGSSGENYRKMAGGSSGDNYRKMAGGAYSDGASYQMYVNGTGNEQWNRTMDQSGPYGQIQGNTIIGAQGQNVMPPSQVPTAEQLALVQKAGRRHSRGRKGGFLGEVVNQAIVPFGLLGLQQTYRRKKGGSRRTRRRHRR